MPNDECRLTYSEGNKIKKDAAKPYAKAALALLLMGIIGGTLFLGYAELDDRYHISDHDELDDLLDGGTISPELHEYLLHMVKDDKVLGGANIMISLIIAAWVMAMVGGIEAEKALAEANRKKGDADE